MGESSEVDTVFLARHSFGRLAFLHVKNLDSLVIRCGNHMLSLVVKIKRRHKVGGVRFRISEGLVSKVSVWKSIKNCVKLQAHLARSVISNDIRQLLVLRCRSH